MPLLMLFSLMMSERGGAGAQELHDLHAGVLGQPDALGVDGRDGAVARQRDAQASHRQFMELAVNMPEQLPQVGQRRALEPVALLVGHGAGGTWPTPSNSGVEVGLLAVSGRGRQASGRRRPARWGCSGGTRR